MVSLPERFYFVRNKLTGDMDGRNAASMAPYTRRNQAQAKANRRNEWFVRRGEEGPYEVVEYKMTWEEVTDG